MTVTELTYTLDGAVDVEGVGAVENVPVHVDGGVLRMSRPSTLPGRIEAAKHRVELALLGGRVDGAAAAWLKAVAAADPGAAVVQVDAAQGDGQRDVYRYSPTVLQHDPSPDPGAVSPRFTWRWSFSRQWEGLGVLPTEVVDDLVW